MKKTEEDKTKKQRIKAIFDAWIILMEEKKELTAQIKDLIGEASAISEKKKPEVRKVFNFFKKLSEDGYDELEGINAFADEMKNEDA